MIHRSNSLSKFNATRTGKPFGAVLGLVLVALLLLAGYASAATIIQTGQALTITVPGHPEFSARVMVASDGTIEYPLLAGVIVNGLTASEVRDLLLPLLMRYESEPEVFIVISSSQIVKVEVYGAVKTPGNYEALSPLNLQRALAMAGGTTPEANIAAVLIVHNEKQQAIEQTIDLTTHFFADTLTITPDLRNGDVVIVPRLSPSTAVRIFGAVHSPGEVYCSKSDNLYDVIVRAGGFMPDADSRRVKLVTPYGRISHNTDFDVFSIMESGHVLDLPLVHPGDIVIVPISKSWRNVSWWIDRLRDAAIFASSLVLLARI